MPAHVSMLPFAFGALLFNMRPSSPSETSYVMVSLCLMVVSIACLGSLVPGLPRPLVPRICKTFRPRARYTNQAGCIVRRAPVSLRKGQDTPFLFDKVSLQPLGPAFCCNAGLPWWSLLWRNLVRSLQVLVYDLLSRHPAEACQWLRNLVAVHITTS